MESVQVIAQAKAYYGKVRLGIKQHAYIAKWLLISDVVITIAIALYAYAYGDANWLLEQF